MNLLDGPDVELALNALAVGILGTVEASGRVGHIAKQVIAKDRAPERVNVYEIMAKPVISVRPDMNTRYCARLFDNFGISHAPVIENEEVLGIVSYYLIALHGLPDLD